MIDIKSKSLLLFFCNYFIILFLTINTYYNVKYKARIKLFYIIFL